jgi:hypothetical protein
MDGCVDVGNATSTAANKLHMALCSKCVPSMRLISISGGKLFSSGLLGMLTYMTNLNW